MATYTNLTSLAGLKPGDIVNYTVTTAFDAKGYKFKVELYGKKVTANGGKTTLTMDSSLLPATILSYNSRGDLIYGNATSLYYRIAVAGDAGRDGYSNSSSTASNLGGKGGGSTGGKGSGSSGGSGGSQTTGGTGSKGHNGGFGTYGMGDSGGGNSGGAGGYGWYGGGGGAYNNNGGGGGSGFIIGVSTSTYPSGYLGNDKVLQQTIASSITEGSLTQGGSTSYTAKMTITIVSKPAGGQSVIEYYDGNEFVNTNAKYYNGTEFVDCDALYYNGTEFIKI